MALYWLPVGTDSEIGRFVEELKDNALPWKGSENQRVIDVQMTRKLGKVVLYA